MNIHERSECEYTKVANEPAKPIKCHPVKYYIIETNIKYITS